MKPIKKKNKKDSQKRRTKHSPEYKKDEWLPPKLHRSEEHKCNYDEEKAKADFTGLLNYKPLIS
jgi:hypothetical protein